MVINDDDRLIVFVLDNNESFSDREAEIAINAGLLNDISCH